nr:PREDICTED: uncharacterized protein LOC105662225 [Megachile rotundata]
MFEPALNTSDDGHPVRNRSKATESTTERDTRSWLHVLELLAPTPPFFFLSFFLPFYSPRLLLLPPRSSLARFNAETFRLRSVPNCNPFLPVCSPDTTTTARLTTYISLHAFDEKVHDGGTLLVRDRWDGQTPRKTPKRSEIEFRSSRVDSPRTIMNHASFGHPVSNVPFQFRWKTGQYTIPKRQFVRVLNDFVLFLRGTFHRFYDDFMPRDCL